MLLIFRKKKDEPVEFAGQIQDNPNLKKIRDTVKKVVGQSPTYISKAKEGGVITTKTADESHVDFLDKEIIKNSSGTVRKFKDSILPGELPW